MNENFMIIDEFQKGLLFIGLDKPEHITLSTYDIDMTLFISEFYEPDIEYDIWYWLSTHQMNLPSNVHLHQLNNNHCKFWYIQTSTTVRLVITSCNITYSMVHGCLQSYYSLTCKRSSLSSSSTMSPITNAITTPTVRDPSKCTFRSFGKGYDPSRDQYHDQSRDQLPKSCKPFFEIFNLTLDPNILKILNSRILYNIPNKCNAIENWYLKQTNLIIDANNINMSYLDTIQRTIIIKTELPPSVGTIVCYYRTDFSSPRLNVQKEQYKSVYHYKLYANDDTLLLSSNNFSFHHKLNYELGVLIPLHA